MYSACSTLTVVPQRSVPSVSGAHFHPALRCSLKLVRLALKMSKLNFKPSKMSTGMKSSNSFTTKAFDQGISSKVIKEFHSLIGYFTLVNDAKKVYCVLGSRYSIDYVLLTSHKHFQTCNTLSMPPVVMTGSEG